MEGRNKTEDAEAPPHPLSSPESSESWQKSNVVRWFCPTLSERQTMAAGFPGQDETDEKSRQMRIVIELGI